MNDPQKIIGFLKIAAASNAGAKLERDSVKQLSEFISSENSLHPSISTFAIQMQEKLDRNRHKTKPDDQWPRNEKGERAGWEGVDIDYLKSKLLEEVWELHVAILEQASIDIVTDEAADIGNIAMMIRDVYAQKNS